MRWKRMVIYDSRLFHTPDVPSKTVAAAFVAELIVDNPWTPRMNARTEAPVRTHYTQRHMPSADVVEATISTLSSMARYFIVDHTGCEVDGSRYGFFVRASFEFEPAPREDSSVA